MMPAVKSHKMKEDTVVTSTKTKTKRFLSKILHPRKHGANKQNGGIPPVDVYVNTNNNNESAAVTTTASAVSTTTTTRLATPTTNNKKMKLKTSWLSRSKWFTKMSDAAFEIVDADESGEVDEKELYSGLLLIHLKLGCYAGPAACRPVSRERVHDVFHKMDMDDSGSLDKEEFREVMMVLCSNIFTRVLVQWSMTLIIVPLVAQYILDAIYFCNTNFWDFVMDLDEYSPVMDKVEVAIENMRDYVIGKLPGIVVRGYHMVANGLEKVPQSVWNTVPLTLLSCILGCLAVPYIIFKIDDYFQAMAEQKKEHVDQQEETKNK